MTTKQFTNTDGVKIGDIFSWSYGYDATFTEYYQVTKILGAHKIEIVEIGYESIADGPCSWKQRPALNHFVGEPKIKFTRAATWNPGAVVVTADIKGYHMYLERNRDPNKWDECDNYH